MSAKHPAHYARSRPTAQGCLPIADALNLKRNGVRVKVGGVVTHRQRPATSKGVIFINLEDETGRLNVVVTPETWNRHGNVARRNPGLTIHGVLEHRDSITNLIAKSFTPYQPTDYEPETSGKG